MNETYQKILNIKYLPTFSKIFIIILINWTFQSLLYMEMSEKIVKFLLDLFFFIIFYFVFVTIFDFYFVLLISFLLAHSLNWIFNGHIYALMKTFGFVKTKNIEFIIYQDELKLRCLKENSIASVATFGSFSRYEIESTSDLDIRIVSKKGNINLLRVCLFTFCERSRAFFNRFPLDIYVINDKIGFSKMKENPIFIFNNESDIADDFNDTESYNYNS